MEHNYTGEVIGEMTWKRIRNSYLRDIEQLLGIKITDSKQFLEVFELLTLHYLIEQIDTNKDCDYQIDLPFFGSLIISNLDNHLSSNFVMNKEFKDNMIKAFKTKESPLANYVMKQLGKELSDKYAEEEAFNFDE